MRHLIEVTRRHGLTYKKTNTKTMANTFGEQLQRTILETSDLWGILSEWWGDTYKHKHKTITKILHEFWICVILFNFECQNSWQSLWPDNQEQHWTAFKILAMFEQFCHKQWEQWTLWHWNTESELWAMTEESHLKVWRVHTACLCCATKVHFCFQ